MRKIKINLTWVIIIIITVRVLVRACVRVAKKKTQLKFIKSETAKKRKCVRMLLLVQHGGFFNNVLSDLKHSFYNFVFVVTFFRLRLSGTRPNRVSLLPPSPSPNPPQPPTRK